MQFDNINGLYALLSLIPLIIIYLKRPRPQDRKLPSLMFVMKSAGFSKANTIFRKLIHNLLFLFQLLVLISLSLAVAVPYFDVPAKFATEHTILVLDISASMQVKQGMNTRFDEVKNLAAENLWGRTSIILAGQNPYIAASSVHQARAHEILDQIESTESVTNLGSAILAAEMLINESKVRVVVISDFINTHGPNPLEAKRVLASKGIDVQFIDVSGEAKNMGIINIEFGNEQSKAYVKNYNSEAASVVINLIKDGKSVDQMKLDIDPYSVETALFSTLPGESMIEIDDKDDFDVDDRAYISSPMKAKINVLLITNQRNSNLELALKSSPKITLFIEEPPKIGSLAYDVIIFSNFNANVLLPSTPRDIERVVRQGANVIIMSQPDIKSINWFELMPVTLGNYLNQSTINVEVMNKFSNYLQQGEAGKYLTTNYFNSTPSNKSVVIATADDGNPLITIKQLDKGMTVYYGIEEEKDFMISTDYPVFWNNLVDFLVGRGDIADYNMKFTDFYTINITKQGIYNIKGKDVSFNLLDEGESDVGASGIDKTGIIQRDLEDFEVVEADQKVPYSFEKYLVIFVFLLFAAEIFIIKSRGDI